MKSSLSIPKTRTLNNLLFTNMKTNKETYELDQITCLYEITKELASSADLRSCLGKVMDILSISKGLNNGTVTIINPVTGQIETEVAHGLTAEARKRGTYKVGEGITGRVVATGAPIIVPQISEEPLFLNRIHRISWFLILSFIPVFNGKGSKGKEYHVYRVNPVNKSLN